MEQKQTIWVKYRRIRVLKSTKLPEKGRHQILTTLASRKEKKVHSARQEMWCHFFPVLTVPICQPRFQALFKRYIENAQFSVIDWAIGKVVCSGAKNRLKQPVVAVWSTTSLLPASFCFTLGCAQYCPLSLPELQLQHTHSIEVEKPQ
jgi:hypothetical protein